MNKKPQIFSIKIKTGIEKPSPHLLNLKKEKEIVVKIKSEIQKPSLWSEKIRGQLEEMANYLPKIKKSSRKKFNQFFTALAKLHKERIKTPHQKKALFVEKQQSAWLTRIIKHTTNQKIPHWPLWRHQTSLITNYGLLWFAILILVILLPLQIINAYNRATSAKSELQDGFVALSNNINVAQNSLSNGSIEELQLSLSHLKTNLEQLHGGLKKFGPLTFYPPIHALNDILQNGNDGITSVINILASIQKLETGQGIITNNLIEIQKELANLSNKLALSKKLLGKVDGHLPMKGKKKISALSGPLSALKENVDYANQVLRLLPGLFGDNNPKNYLLIFQNNNELRPTGGFIGSFAVIQIENGQLKKYKIPGGGSYDLQGSLTNRIAAPQPLWLINPRFEFQDLNWFPDFPTSAKKIIETYEKADGQTMDGVIAINAGLVADLLKILGPITMPDSKIIIDGDNFMETTQRAVEIDYDKKENQPKKFIAQLFPKIIDLLTSGNHQQNVKVTASIFSALFEKKIQIYLSDNDLENMTRKLGWGGEMKDSDGDYLMVVNSNIAGGKTDGAIKQNIEKETFIGQNGKIINRIKISRQHNGLKDNFWTGKRNVNFLRIYVPLGSKLLESSGFNMPPDYLFEAPDNDLTPDPDIRRIEMTETRSSNGTLTMEENGKTVFANWLILDPGQTQEAIISYELPSYLDLNRLPALYTLNIQKQPGRDNDEFRNIIKLRSNQIIDDENIILKSDMIISSIIKVSYAL